MVARRNPWTDRTHGPDIEYVNPAEAVETGTRRGVAAFTTAVEGVFDGWETWRAEPEEFTVVRDQVAVKLRYRARGRGSGVEVEGRKPALGPSAMAGSSATPGFTNLRMPLKPPGCRSRRCRGRTSSSSIQDSTQ